MKIDRRRQRHVEISEDDEIDFRPVKEMLARNVRRPVEPEVWRSLVIAMIVGVALGLFVYFFKPSPRAAVAAPTGMMNVETAPQSDSNDLFQLPAWDEKAAEQDQKKSAK